jgi:hypothetical protein
MRSTSRIGTSAIACLLCAALTACASAPPRPTTSKPQGSVDVRELKAVESERYDHAGHVDDIQPLAYPENVAPAYPADLLARRSPPTAVAVRLIVDTNGAVTEVQPLDAMETPGQKLFFGAISSTCRQWKFSRLIRLDLDAGPTTVVEDGASVLYSGRPKALPFHRDYAFGFSQQDGKPHVDTVEREAEK